MDYEIFNGLDPLEAFLNYNADCRTQSVNDDDDVISASDLDVKPEICEGRILHNKNIDRSDESSVLEDIKIDQFKTEIQPYHYSHNKEIDLSDGLSALEDIRIKKDKFKTEIHPYHYTGPYIKQEVKSQRQKYFQCPFDICKRLFFHEAFYKSHIILHLNNTNLECKYCCKVYRDKNQLMEHQSQHRGKDGELKLFHCRVIGCGHKCLSTYMLQQHQISKHSTRLQTYNCEVCSKNFRIKGTYMKHLSTHNTLRSYKCIECGKFFRTLGERNSHARVHDNKKDFVCELCGFEFSRYTNLKRHYIIHKGKNYFCKICFVNFSHQASLTKHVIKIHPNARRRQLEVVKGIKAQS